MVNMKQRKEITMTKKTTQEVQTVYGGKTSKIHTTSNGVRFSSGDCNPDNFYPELKGLKGDDLTLKIYEPFLPKRVLRLTKKNQLKYINKSDKKFNDALAKIDIKLTKKGEVKEKNRFGQWEAV